MEASADAETAPVHWGESAVEWAAAVALIGAGMASGFTHIVTNADKHHVHGWLRWAIAITIELVGLYAVVKLRRRLAEKRRVWPPALLGVAGLGISMASQLAEAERSVWGWVYNGWPVIGGLWVAKLTLSDLAHRAGAVDHARRVTEDHLTHLREVMTQVEVLGHDLGQERALTQQVTQELTQARAERDAEVARLGGEVQRLTARLEVAERERVEHRPESPPRSRRDRRPDTDSAVEDGGQGETQRERAARMAVALRDDGGGVWPTQGALAEAAGVSVSTAKLALRELRTPGLKLVEESA